MYIIEFTHTILIIKLFPNLELNDKGRHMALINSKVDTQPITPPNPTVNDIGKMSTERNCLHSSKLLIQRKVEFTS